MQSSPEALNGRKTDNTMNKRKSTYGKTMIYKILHRKLKIEQHEPHWNRGELMCFGRVNSLYSLIFQWALLNFSYRIILQRKLAVFTTLDPLIYIYILKIAELDCCQIIILSIYVPSTHAYTHVLRLSLDLPYETR